MIDSDRKDLTGYDCWKWDASVPCMGEYLGLEERRKRTPSMWERILFTVDFYGVFRVMLPFERLSAF